MNNPTQLDSFESALLAELRREVAAHPAPVTAPAVARRPKRRLRLAAVAATGVAASVVAVFGTGGTGGSPAYAVQQDGDGDVIVTVHRLDDASGLERALADKGIDADVSYDPKTSVDGSYTVTSPDAPPPDAAPPGALSDEQGEGVVEWNAEGGSEPAPDAGQGSHARGGDACSLGTDPATLQQQQGDWVLRIPAGSPLQDRHVAITTSVDGTLSVFYAGDEPDTVCGVVSMSEPQR